ncbi:hypothetical protein [Bacillus swezeyi]|uniref:hypothetical protein n=1 Tax=Bacillus swezeyi TaxID=1925020 RepID=UPI0027DE6A75|nr:hypothetical protein [Bacillus swezeyi]
METRISKAESNQNNGLIDYYEGKLKKLMLLRKQTNDYLRKQNTKIQETVTSDDMFVEYHYYIKTEEGGIKEGRSRYWKEALKLYMMKDCEKGRSLAYLNIS